MKYPLLAVSHQMRPCVVTSLCLCFIAPLHGARRWGNGNKASKCSNDRGDEEDEYSTAAPTTEAGGFAEESTIGQDEPDESDTELLVPSGPASDAGVSCIGCCGGPAGDAGGSCVGSADCAALRDADAPLSWLTGMAP